MLPVRNQCFALGILFEKSSAGLRLAPPGGITAYSEKCRSRPVHPGRMITYSEVILRLACDACYPCDNARLHRHLRGAGRRTWAPQPRFADHAAK